MLLFNIYNKHIEYDKKFHNLETSFPKYVAFARYTTKTCLMRWIITPQKVIEKNLYLFISVLF